MRVMLVVGGSGSGGSNGESIAGASASVIHGVTRNGAVQRSLTQRNSVVLCRAGQGNIQLSRDLHERRIMYKAWPRRQKLQSLNRSSCTN